MESVGVRDLKNRLSEFLRRVAQGETILVTDRGRIVAELRKPELVAPGWEHVDLPPAFWQAVARGEIILARQREPACGYEPPPPLGLPPGTAQRLLDADRAE